VPRRSARPVCWLLAALLVGASAIHFAMAPSHFGESWVIGAGFLVSAWAQAALAVGVVVRPARVLGAVLLTSLVLIGVWAVSRTAGLPFGAHGGHADSVTVVDGVCVAMEAVTAVIAIALIARPAARIVPRAVAWAGAAVAIVLTTAVIASPSARNHALASHGEHVTTTGSAAAGAAAHDHGATPTTAPGEPADPLALNGQHVHGVKAGDIAAESQPDVPLDAATRTLLAAQLVQARAAAIQYPTVADATAAGYILAGGFTPGSGAHYISIGQMGAFDAAHPFTLIYDGTSPTSEVIGLMYYGMGDTAPEGFAGPNDHWHRHSNVCLKPGTQLQVPFPADADVTEEQCAAVQGVFMQVTGWMVHAWVVPTWESPLGVFSHDNPNVRCADGTYDTDAAGFCQGT
jgi:hypothetical protein